MDLLKKITAFRAEPVSEDVSAAGDVAGAAMPLFSSLNKRTLPTTPKKEPKQRVVYKHAVKKQTLRDKFKQIAENQAMDDVSREAGAHANFDPSEVVSRLKSLENREKAGSVNATVFGIKDDNDDIVEVSVKPEQADEFEKALQSLQSSTDEVDGSSMDVAEILFRLKDQFDILDVVWPDVVEDEEELQQLKGDGEDLAGDDATNGEFGSDLDAMDEEQPLGAPPASAAGGEDVAGLLNQVIDMMKADAEARKAEARAREAEAKTKEADAIVAQSMARVKQEEQYLDMETYNKAKKEEDREAKRLAQLAKWKHDMAGDAQEDDVPSLSMPYRPNRDAASEEEESTFPRAEVRKPYKPKSRVSPHDVASFIINRVK